MTTLCCISPTLAARMIGALGLSTSILMINVLLSVFVAREVDDEFLKKFEIWALLGLNWTRFIKSTQIQKQVQYILLCFLAYSLIYLITSGLLAVGTIFRKPNYALPWLYFQMINIADQMVFLTSNYWSHPYDNYATNNSNWYIPLYSIYSIISVYFWIIVFHARENWIASPDRYGNVDIFNPIPEVIISDSNIPKTPSYLAQNYCFNESHMPPVQPVKYNVI